MSLEDMKDIIAEAERCCGARCKEEPMMIIGFLATKLESARAEIARLGARVGSLEYLLSGEVLCLANDLADGAPDASPSAKRANHILGRLREMGVAL